MEKINLQRPSGTIDFLPEEMKKRREVYIKLEKIFQSFGFEQIELPMYEFFEIYKKRSGEKIINDIFTFYDPPKHRADENPALYALRPEYTASLARFYITSELMYRPKPQKYYYIGPCFRYDEPAPGRFRQFTQAGIEIFGADTATADAEMLIVAMNVMERFEMQDYILRINDLTILRSYLEEEKLSPSQQKKIFGIVDRITSLLRKLEIGALDEEQTEQNILNDYYGSMQEEKIPQAIIERLEQLLYMTGKSADIISRLNQLFSEYPKTLEAISKSKIQRVSTLIEAADIKNYVIDCGIARGLDYYTNIVFEIDVPVLGKQKQICGGGRYNEMIRAFGGEETPALGFSFGFDRIILALERQEKFPPEQPRSEIFIGTKAETQTFGIEIAKILRKNGIRVEIDIMNRSFRSVSKFVNRMKIPFLLFLGPKEQEQKRYTLKNFITGDQNSNLSLNDVISKIQEFEK
ncbi:MAG: histidine--tRNA ligase [Candidatus Lokiarchaeota archaeon]|nr:histidine--tRNA ligase [Candidatus Harpocratesius repetitus]